MMTPEETKEYIERRLREMGWAARIDKESYEKIYRFTEGSETGANQVCYKLLSLGSLQASREITDDLISVAIDDLVRVDEIVKRSGKATTQTVDGEPDVASIEQLAAVLEAKVTAGELSADAWMPEPPKSVARSGTNKAPSNKTDKPSARSAARAPENKAASAAAAVTVPASKPAAKPNEKSPVVTSADRIAPARPTSRAYRAATSPAPTQNAFLQQLYRFGSTATITLSATVLVVIAIAMILFINRPGTQPAKAVATSSAGAVAAPAPAEPPRVVEPTASPAVTAEADRRSTIAIPKRETAMQEGAIKESDRARSKTNTASVGTQKTTPEAVPQTPPPALTAPVPVPSQTAKAPNTPALPTPSKPSESKVNGSASTNMPAVNSDAQTAAVDRAVRPARPKITKEELSALLRRFAFVYEAGDLDQFVNLFSDNARTNDKSTRQGIREDYENFFRSTDLRQMNLGQVNWEVDENQAQGWGNFDVTVRRSGEQEVQAYSGSLSFYVEKVDGRLRIVRLYHGQRRAGL